LGLAKYTRGTPPEQAMKGLSFRWKGWLGRLDSFYVRLLMMLNLPVFRGASTALVGHSAESCYKFATNRLKHFAAR
jgi:hypothetical protein